MGITYNDDGSYTVTNEHGDVVLETTDYDLALQRFDPRSRDLVLAYEEEFKSAMRGLGVDQLV